MSKYAASVRLGLVRGGGIPGVARGWLAQDGNRRCREDCAGTARRFPVAVADLTKYAYKNGMKLDWDETKRQATLRERGLDFADAAQLDWETAIIFDDVRQDYGERRQVCLGRLRAEVVVVAFTFRGDALRVISMRMANRRERKLHDDS